MINFVGISGVQDLLIWQWQLQGENLSETGKKIGCLYIHTAEQYWKEIILTCIRIQTGSKCIPFLEADSNAKV